METEHRYAVFDASHLVAQGELASVLEQTKCWLDGRPDGSVLVFEETTGQQVEFDFSGTLVEVLAREAPPQRTGPGRPRLGVTSREVSLLPRHWGWLESQPRGMSATLRRLVDDAQKREPDKARARRARDAVGRMMSALAGNLPGYEEATRALYRGQREEFERRIHAWPADFRGTFERLMAQHWQAD